MDSTTRFTFTAAGLLATLSLACGQPPAEGDARVLLAVEATLAQPELRSRVAVDAHGDRFEVVDLEGHEQVLLARRSPGGALERACVSSAGEARAFLAAKAHR